MSARHRADVRLLCSGALYAFAFALWPAIERVIQRPGYSTVAILAMLGVFLPLVYGPAFIRISRDEIENP